MAYKWNKGEIAGLDRQGECNASIIHARKVSLSQALRDHVARRLVFSLGAARKPGRLGNGFLRFERPQRYGIDPCCRSEVCEITWFFMTG